MTADFELTAPEPTEPERRVHRTPSLCTDDDHLVRRCVRCARPFRRRGFPLSLWWMEAVLRAFRRRGGEPTGVCPDCEGKP